MFYTLGFVYGDGEFKNNRAELTICMGEKKRCIAGLKHVGFGSYENTMGFTKIYFKDDEMFVNRDQFVFPFDVIETHNLSDKAQFIAGLYDANGVLENGRVLLLYKKREFLKSVMKVLSQLHIESEMNAGVLSINNLSLFAALVPTLRLLK